MTGSFFRLHSGPLKFISGSILGIGAGFFMASLLGRSDNLLKTGESSVAPSPAAWSGSTSRLNEPVSLPSSSLLISPRAEGPALDADAGTSPLEGVLKSVELQRRQQIQAQSALVDRIRRDPGLKSALFAKYKTIDPADADELRWLLQQVGAAEALQFATQLASSADAKERAKAYALLQGADQDEAGPASRFLRERLLQESDPTALGWLVSSIDSKAGIALEERKGVAERLQQLSQHQDPELRAQSLEALARWASPADVQATLFSALQDPSSAVQITAIHALMDARVSSSPVRQSLFQMARDSAQSPETRQTALLALEQMDLSKDEFAWLIQARDSLR